MKTICESCCDSPATLVACGREGTVLCGTCDTPRYAPTSVTLLSRGPRGRRWITRVDRGRRSSNLRSEGRDTRERVADRTYPTLLPPRDVFSPDTCSVQGERVAFVAGPETATQAPLPCDICQSAPAVALCHEDRAFLCRACDASIHSANEHVAAHSRFLFTNVKLELEPVGASKKRKAAEMRSSDSTDLATPALGNRRLEGRVPDAVHDAVHDAVNDVFGYPIGVVDGVADPFAAEFLHLDGRRDDGKVKPMGVLDDAEHFVSAFFDRAGAGADDFGVVPAMY